MSEVTEQILKNVFDMALEELSDLDYVDKRDFKAFRNRLNHLLDQIEQEII